MKTIKTTIARPTSRGEKVDFKSETKILLTDRNTGPQTRLFIIHAAALPAERQSDRWHLVFGLDWRLQPGYADAKSSFNSTPGRFVLLWFPVMLQTSLITRHFFQVFFWGSFCIKICKRSLMSWWRLVKENEEVQNCSLAVNNFFLPPE